MSQEIHTAFDAILRDANVTFSAIYVREAKRALGGDTSMDQWSCAFTKGDGQEAHEEFDYFTGLGHRKGARPVPPHAADVLQCLVSDADARHMTFEDWCADFGYDNDSRKAEAIYNACCNTT